MRRKDREMGRDFGLTIIDKSQYAVLSVTDLNYQPYAIPLSVVRKDDWLYFHSAKSGTKVDLLQSGATVCVTFVGKVNVPELYSNEELVEMENAPNRGGEMTSHIFTTEFESSIVFGKVSLVEEESQKLEALRILCEKYTPSKMALFDIAAQSGMKATNIYRVSIDSITAKRKKFDANGNEMKWGL